MKEIKYVGSHHRGVTIRLPYPHVAKSEERSVVVFSGLGDIQKIENDQDAADLAQNGGGQFEYVDVPKKPKQEESSTPATEDEVQAVVENPAKPKKSNFRR